jgi:hypothetical protein
VLPAAQSRRHRDLHHKTEPGNMNSGADETCTGMAAVMLSGQTGTRSSPIYATLRAYSRFI